MRLLCNHEALIKFIGHKKKRGFSPLFKPKTKTEISIACSLAIVKFKGKNCYFYILSHSSHNQKLRHCYDAISSEYISSYLLSRELDSKFSNCAGMFCSSCFLSSELSIKFMA